MALKIKKGVPAPTKRVVKAGKMSGGGMMKSMPMMKPMPKMK